MTEITDPTDDRVISRFKDWFWRPPRRHGEILEDRTVTFLELFYDLVYVVVIAQAAHHLAAHVSLAGALQFGVIFGLIWIAWLNGSLYHEIHGQRDGRTRTFVFIQMAILALLATFTGDAAGDSGTEFALVYAIYLGVMAWLWYGVRRIDEQQYMRATGVYLVAMVATVSAVLVSAFVGEGVRLMLWAVVVIVWVVGYLLIGLIRETRLGWEAGVTATDSMVERFGLFTIIVLGEVVAGVVNGMTEAGLEHRHDTTSYATGLLALIVGFGLWWLYFDLTGRRRPRGDGPATTRWMIAHGFIGLGIAAAGASMVGLIVHAQDGVTPPESAWLLTGSVAVVFVAIAAATQTLELWTPARSIYGPTVVALLVGAGASLVLGWLQPAPWLLALLLALLMGGIWVFAVNRWLASGLAQDRALPN
jgi:low temperature requirement protein LtrA